MVIDADPTPFWIAVPGLLAVSLILLIYSGALRPPDRNQLRRVGDRSPILRYRSNILQFESCPNGADILESD